MADAGKFPFPLLLLLLHLFSFRLFQGHICRPRSPLLGQGAKAPQNNQVSSPVRYKSNSSYPLLSSSINSTRFLQVDMRKVNLQVIRPWVAKKVVELVGFEDEVLVEYAMGLLEDASQPVNIFSFAMTPLHPY
jgi:hypothetical protein